MRALICRNRLSARPLLSACRPLLIACAFVSFSTLAHAAEPSPELLKAAQQGNTAVINDLLIRNVDISLRDASGYDALDYSIEWGQYEASLLLLNHALQAHLADDDAKAYAAAALKGGPLPAFSASTALRTALLRIVASKGDTAMVKALLNDGLSADAGADTGYTALALAVRWQRSDSIDALLAAGANANTHTNTCYRTTTLMEAARHGSTDIAKRLISSGAKVNEPDRYGDHALNWAAFFGHTAFAKLLVEHGADLGRTGQSDDQPVEIAIRQKHAELESYLRSVGAKPRPGKDRK